MKHKITVSDCCGAVVGVWKQDIGYTSMCTKCGKRVPDAKTITCTPDEDIAEVLKDKLFTDAESKEAEFDSSYHNAIIRSIAEQLNIEIK